MGKLLKCHLKGKTCIDYSEKKNGPRASSAPVLGLFSISFYIQISGERLQDHWFSGLLIVWTTESINFWPLPLGHKDGAQPED